ncbi:MULTISPECIES: response regulator [Pseudomonadaceae]|jgi:CheY-like chemotaxis protein|uniref:Response regulator n=2 Tax=Pseudomonadaceae TaxID=135621 RepID=A0A1G5PCL5_9PSED|nr:MULTISPECIES: response regulator [Pseudomonas]MBA1258844.1 response regulator [Pseudomonas psychrotolerans]MBH3328148.1 response regulator [Pseudomonas oryzihabitans]MDK4200482.1 response regulator [Pseudomonas sp. HR1]NMY89464.1 response regulator [Pseudomonas psychrotolerans]NMZ46218.1 response regulator [Pseudomonas oryzihabitans]
MKFLVVDDSRAVQTIIKRILANTGYRDIELRVASTGEEAVALLESWTPNLVLTDWHMPGMTGLELLQAIRQRVGADIHVGFVTTESSARNIEAAYRNGAAFVVTKPFAQETLQQAVLTVLQDGASAEQAIESSGRESLPIPTRFNPDPQRIRQLLGLSSIVCQIEPMAPIPVDRLALPYVIGIYGHPQSKALEAVCLLDLNAACILGGSLAGLAPAAIHSAIASATLSREIYENATAFLADLSGMISAGKGGAPLVLSTSHLVQKPFEKLYSLWRQNNGRADFSLSFPGLGDGFIAFLLS